MTIRRRRLAPRSWRCGAADCMSATPVTVSHSAGLSVAATVNRLPDAGQWRAAPVRPWSVELCSLRFPCWCKDGCSVTVYDGQVHCPALHQEELHCTALAKEDTFHKLSLHITSKRNTLNTRTLWSPELAIPWFVHKTRQWTKTWLIHTHCALFCLRQWTFICINASYLERASEFGVIELSLWPAQSLSYSLHKYLIALNYLQVNWAVWLPCFSDSPARVKKKKVHH